MTSIKPLDAVLSPIVPSDYPEIAAWNRLSFPGFYEPLEVPGHPIAHLDALAAHRIAAVVSSPHTLATKATSPSGELLGIAIWHRPSAPVFHLKRRPTSAEARALESDADKAAWEVVEPDAWEKVWGTWDAAREKILGGVPAWYLAPLWVKPEHQGKKVASKLLKQVLDLADQEGDAIYLEASQDGKPIYEKLGFVVEGPSAYVEMVRWGASREKKAKADAEGKKQ